MSSSHGAAENSENYILKRKNLFSRFFFLSAILFSSYVTIYFFNVRTNNMPIYSIDHSASLPFLVRYLRFNLTSLPMWNWRGLQYYFAQYA